MHMSACLCVWERKKRKMERQKEERVVMFVKIIVFIHGCVPSLMSMIPTTLSVNDDKLLSAFKLK